MNAADALLHACARLDASSRELFRVTGPDRATFLHGMVTNDITGLPVGGTTYAAMLTAKGAMVGDCRVLVRPDELVVDTGAGRSAAVLDFLNKYLISEEAELVPAPELAVVSLVGPQAEQVAARVPNALGRFRSFFAGAGVDLVVPRAELPALETALSDVPVLTSDEAEVLRVERGVPVFGVDMTETTIPLEANLEHAIHYQKGCYIGQEVIARATYRGQMNKKLVGFTLSGLTNEQPPAPKTELQVNGAKAGWVTSVVRSARHGQLIALGYVKRDLVTPGTTLDIAGGGTATVTPLPFA